MAKLVAEMLGAYKKAYGTGVGSYGGTLTEVERLPSGFFELDLALGGGFPKGATSIVYGSESSNKTNTALSSIRNHQLLWPAQTCVFVDVENSFDPTWAQKMGVDTDKLLILNPDYAEQAGDMIEGLLAAEDCGLIVLDSVAAMDAAKMLEKSMEDQIMGGIGVIMSRLCGKIINQMRQAEKQGRPSPTILFLNQIRKAVGIVYGSPFKLPGGDKQKFLASAIVRQNGKNIIDSKISKVMPVAKEVSFVIEKWKVPICAINGAYTMTTIPHKGLKVGDCDNFNSVAAILKATGKLVKHEKSGWLLNGYHYSTLAAAEERFYADLPYALSIKSAIIAQSIAEGGIAAQADDE